MQGLIFNDHFIYTRLWEILKVLIDLSLSQTRLKKKKNMKKRKSQASVSSFDITAEINVKY